MVVYVTYRVPVEVEQEVETGEVLKLVEVAEWPGWTFGY